jgi:hypothetical protein
LTVHNLCSSQAKVKLNWQIKISKTLISKDFKLNLQSDKMKYLTQRGYRFDALLPIIIVKMAFTFWILETAYTFSFDITQVE